MTIRSIKKLHPARRDDIGPLMTRRPLPGPDLPQIDPFLFLNHHGPQVYPANNPGLPFEAHPHRGFETLTFILKGDLVHRDSAGYESRIAAGGVQWMTAGSGIIHSETSSDEFKKNGGDIEILQLWINLPAKLKMTKPAYTGLQKSEIPSFTVDQGKAVIHLIAGKWLEHSAPIQSLTGITMMTIEMQAGAKVDFSISQQRHIFFYLVKGTTKINGKNVEEAHLVEFQNDGEEIAISALDDATVILGHGTPIGEPVVAHGPFVMNTRDEILIAIRDYQAGKFG